MGLQVYFTSKLFVLEFIMASANAGWYFFLPIFTNTGSGI